MPTSAPHPPATTPRPPPRLPQWQQAAEAPPSRYCTIEHRPVSAPRLRPPQTTTRQDDPDRCDHFGPPEQTRHRRRPHGTQRHARPARRTACPRCCGGARSTAIRSPRWSATPLPTSHRRGRWQSAPPPRPPLRPVLHHGATKDLPTSPPRAAWRRAPQGSSAWWRRDPDRGVEAKLVPYSGAIPI